MTPIESLQKLKNFDKDEASLSLWVFKSSTSKNANFKAYSVVVTPKLSRVLRDIAKNTLKHYTEVEEYALLAQPNECGCLSLATDETIFPELCAAVDLPVEEHLIQSLRQIENSAGYIVRMQLRDRVMYCVKRLAQNWRTTKRVSVINTVLNGNQLDVISDETFSIAKNFDFFALDSDLIICNKASFESLLNYTHTYINSFEILKQDPAFGAVFSDLSPLVRHVGTNAMHLRRMAVIQRRALYADVTYMSRLREVNVQRNWNIKFDELGRITPTEETMRAIMQVLLNHRLRSELSQNDFDVSSSTLV